MNKKYLGIVAGLLILAGCSNDDLTDNENKVRQESTSFTTVKATIGDTADTRTFLVSDGTSNGRSVTWDEEHEGIIVFSDEKQEFSIYSLISTENNVGTFGGEEVTGKNFYALYPQRNWAFDDENPNILHFNFWNGYASNSNNYQFGAPMLAMSEDNNFVFKQLTGLIHISICNLYKIQSAGIYANSNEALSGEGYVDLSVEEPVLMLTNRRSSVAGYWNEEILDGSVRDIYFYIPPTTFENGFTLRIGGYDKDGNEINLSKSINSKIVVERAQVRNFEIVDVNAELVAIENAKIRQKEILKKFYDAMDGDNWKDKTNWNSDKPLNEWYGIRVNAQGIVESMSFYNNNLSGNVPTEICELTSLTSFTLVGDYQNGSVITFPESMGNLTSLWDLHISNIPMNSFPEWIFKLKNLHSLSVTRCQIEDNLPNDLAKMKSLESLYLSSNNFEDEIPASYFTELTNLRGLELSGNRLTGTITLGQQQSAMWQNLEYVDVINQQNGYGIEIEGAVKTIKVVDDNGNSYLKLPVGKSVQLQAIIEPDDALNKNVEWSISYWSDNDGNSGYDANNGIATLENGLVTALKLGRIGVKVKALDNNGAEGYCTIIVVEPTNGSIDGFNDTEILDWDNNNE